MRNAQKQKVLGCIESLHQAHEEIAKALKLNEIFLAQNMLGECQEFAVSLGKNIEKLEKKGHITVSYLEGYCETLFHVYRELGSGRFNVNKLLKSLKKQLLKVESSARNDIRVRREVIFLPYKASMWDSLESVWRAADADENTDAYVIPIPYYDKNPDGSLKKEYYEGGQYPIDVPVLNYEEYDLEEHRPDIIFIHNPYDGCNYVTSVHPRFYSSNLKKYTEKLVYIPYFLLGEFSPDNQEAIDSMKHFCTVPGVINADKVIVQSEDMKKVYVKVLLEEMGDKGMEARTYWENKILGLGSPKIDKVLSTEGKHIVLPSKWEPVVKKAEGIWKKIILYNTSISALLEHNERMLKKIESTFEIFREHQDEVALLWRPHPLTESTLISMRPWLWEEYKSLRDKYIQEQWGIYDDTPELNRAIAISDAYYGDPSSVIQLFQQTGKPIMVQNVEVEM